MNEVTEWKAANNFTRLKRCSTCANRHEFINGNLICSLMAKLVSNNYPYSDAWKEQFVSNDDVCDMWSITADTERR